jgi:predicted nucleic acid-binding protein
VAGETLVDAGPLVAILHRDDPDHDACVGTLRTLSDPLLTTWAPIAEAMYLLESSRDARDALLQMIERGAVQVEHIQIDEIPSIRALMRKYSDLPMDFADATLVNLAEKKNTVNVFTLDRRDFGIYRLSRRRTFRIVP